MEKDETVIACFLGVSLPSKISANPLKFCRLTWDSVLRLAKNRSTKKLCFDSLQEQKIFLFPHRVQIGSGTQTPSILVSTGVLSPRLKRPEREGDLSRYLVLTQVMGESVSLRPLHYFSFVWRKIYFCVTERLVLLNRVTEGRLRHDRQTLFTPAVPG